MTYNLVDPDLSIHTVHVYEAVLQAWQDYGQSPSYVNLQHACQISAPTVRKAISTLKKKGYVTAPKFQVRAIKPTDLNRTVSNREPSPWDALAPPKKYFKGG